MPGYSERQAALGYQDVEMPAIPRWYWGTHDPSNRILRTTGCPLSYRDIGDLGMLGYPGCQSALRYWDNHDLEMPGYSERQAALGY